MDRVDVEQWKAREVARLLALVESERRYYQEIIAALPVGLAVVSREGTVQSANRAFRQLFGLRTEDMRRRTIDQFLPSSGLLEKIAEVASSARTESGLRIEVPESRRILRGSLLPIRDWDEDTELEVLLVFEDLTGVAAAAHESPALIWSANTDTLDFTALNESDAIHPGFSSERIHSDDRDRTVEFYRDAFAKPGTHACEYQVTGEHGEVLWFRDTFRVMESKTATGVVTDITGRMIGEQMAMNGHRLEALASISRTITHDLNNRLMIVTGYGEELLASFDARDPRRNEMQEVMNAAERIGGLSNQLLTFTHKQARPAEPLRVSDIVRRAVGLGDVEKQVDPQIWAMADAGQLEEALRAIILRLRRQGELSIAAKYTHSSEQVSEGLKPGDYTEIIFKCAAPPKLTFDSLLPGKDLGGPDLAKAHAIVREWGGGIWQSDLALHILLPAAPAPPPPPESVAAPVEAEHVEQAPELQPEPMALAPVAPEPEPQLETILVVEDEDGIRALVRKILRREHYQVLEAGTAEEAIAVAGKHADKIDLLVTDMTLPQRNGRELADQLSNIIPNLKVLYVSGYTDDASIAEGDLPPGAAFLQKPFTLGSLLKKVEEVLGK